MPRHQPPEKLPDTTFGTSHETNWPDETLADLGEQMFEAFISLGYIPPTEHSITAPSIPYGQFGEETLAIHLQYRGKVITDGHATLLSPSTKQKSLFCIVDRQVTSNGATPLEVTVPMRLLDRYWPTNSDRDNTALRELADKESPTVNDLAQVLQDCILPLANTETIKSSKTYVLFDPIIKSTKPSGEELPSPEHHPQTTGSSDATQYLLCNGYTARFTVAHADLLLPWITLEVSIPCTYNYTAAEAVATVTRNPNDQVSLELTIKQGKHLYSTSNPENYSGLVGELSYILDKLVAEQLSLAT